MSLPLRGGNADAIPVQEARAVRARLDGLLRQLGVLPLVPELDEWPRRRARMCYWKQGRLCRTKISHLPALAVGERTAIIAGVGSERCWHLSRSKATQVGMTNDCLKANGLASIRDLWMKAHGCA